MGFPLDDAKLRRAGLDYHEYAHVLVHEDWQACQQVLNGRRVFAVTTKGSVRYDQVLFRPGDIFLFGSESRGLPKALLDGFSSEYRIRLPMQSLSRSMNLSNAVAVTVYEAWRQNHFAAGV